MNITRMRKMKQIPPASNLRENLLYQGQINQGLYFFIRKELHISICFRIPKKLSVKSSNSNPEPFIPKFQKSFSNQNKNSGQLKQLRDNGKKEVKNFGFPSSFGEAGVDFPMFDLHRLGYKNTFIIHFSYLS